MTLTGFIFFYNDNNMIFCYMGRSLVGSTFI